MGIGSMQEGKQVGDEQGEGGVGGWGLGVCRKGNRWEMNRVREGWVGGDWEYAGRETGGR